MQTQNSQIGRASSVSSSSSFRAIRIFCSQDALGQSFLSGYLSGPSEIYNDAFPPPFENVHWELFTTLPFVHSVAFFCLFTRLVISYHALHFVNDHLQGGWMSLSSLKGNWGSSSKQKERVSPPPCACVWQAGHQQRCSLARLSVSPLCDCSLRLSLCVSHKFIQFCCGESKTQKCSIYNKYFWQEKT